MTRLWRLLVGAQREVERTAWGGFLLGNVWPAYIFALPLFARVVGFVQTRPGDTRHEQAQWLQELVTIIFLGLVVVLFVVRRRTLASDHASVGPGLVALAGTFLLNAVAYLPIDVTTSTELLLTSAIVTIVGTLWTIWSLANLGRCFGLFPEARGLVLRGPYQVVRHPVYLGEIISALGMLIARPNPLIVALFVVFVGLQYWRTVYEERVLSVAFPSDYPAYQQKVPRLLPGVRP